MGCALTFWGDLDAMMFCYSLYLIFWIRFLSVQSRWLLKAVQLKTCWNSIFQVSKTAFYSLTPAYHVLLLASSLELYHLCFAWQVALLLSFLIGSSVNQETTYPACSQLLIPNAFEKVAEPSWRQCPRKVLQDKVCIKWLKTRWHKWGHRAKRSYQIQFMCFILGLIQQSRLVQQVHNHGGGLNCDLERLRMTRICVSFQEHINAVLQCYCIKLWAQGNITDSVLKTFQIPKSRVLNPLKSSGQECFAKDLFLLSTYRSSPCLGCTVLCKECQAVC